MLRNIGIIMLVCMLLSGCSALPAEERAFAVALGITLTDGRWEASARIPGYTSEGGYLTLTAAGNTLREALARLDETSPMRMHYGQVRLLVLGHELAASEQLSAALKALAQRADMRLQAAVCVTEDEVGALVDALQPQTGMRLSKSLDVLLETRKALGVIPDASLSEIMRRGERQQTVLISAGLKQEKLSGENEKGTVQLQGGYLTDSRGCVCQEATGEEMQMLALLQGRLKKAVIDTGEKAIEILGASASTTLQTDGILCRVRIKTALAEEGTEGVALQLEQALQALGSKLTAIGCDALGVGWQAMHSCRDLQAWAELDWPQTYARLPWEIHVTVHAPA